MKKQLTYAQLNAQASEYSQIMQMFPIASTNLWGIDTFFNRNKESLNTMEEERLALLKEYLEFDEKTGQPKQVLVQPATILMEGVKAKEPYYDLVYKSEVHKMGFLKAEEALKNKMVDVIL